MPSTDGLPYRLNDAGWSLLEDVVRQFEANWSSTDTIDLIDYLPDEIDAGDQAAVLFELVQVDLELRLKVGKPIRVEHYLARYPSLNDTPEAVLDLLAAEFRTRSGFEPTVSTDEFLDRFPELATEIKTNPKLFRRARSRHLAPPELPGYELLEELGRGGMGVVYKVRDLLNDDILAVKLLHPFISGSRTAEQRFHTEAGAAARLHHPHIVRVVEVGTTPVAYLMMQYVTGGSLASRLNGTPYPAGEAAGMIAALAGAMEHAHDAGIIHRDLKPSNVLLNDRVSTLSETWATVDGFVPQVADFGLAKLLQDDTGPTMTGDMLGTPAYMAPEQVVGQEIGPATDVYALGVMLYELLTGRVPHRGATALETAALVRTTDPISPRTLQPNCPRDLETICLKCLRKRPRDRYRSAAELAADLHRFGAGRAIVARPPGLLAQAAHWSRRRPTAAALLFVAVLVTMAGLGVWAAVTQELRQERDEASRQRKLAEDREQQVREQYVFQQRLLLTNTISKVAGQWSNDPVGSFELLHDATRCPPELRDFAWGVYDRLCDPHVHTIKSLRQPAVNLVYSLDDRFLVAAASSGPIHVWDARTGRDLVQLTTDDVPVHQLAFSFDSALLAAACEDGTVRFWDTTAHPVPVPSLRVDDQPVRAVVFDPSNDRLATASEDGVVRIWDRIRGSNQFRVATTFTGHTGAVTRLNFSPDGALLGSLGEDGNANVWSTDRRLAGDQALLHTFPCGDRNPRVVTFSKNSISIRIMTRLHARTWKLSRNAVSGMFNLKDRPIDAATTTMPFAALFAVATAEENTVRVWCHIRKHTVATLPAMPCPVTAVALSRDGRWVAAAGEDSQIRVWRVFAEVGEGVEHAHPAQIDTLAFDPSGDRVFSQDASGMVKCWPVNPAEPLRAQHGEAVTNPPSLTSSPTTTPDGRTRAEPGPDGEIRLIDVASGNVRITLPGPHESARLPGNPPAVTALAFGPNGRVLVAGYADGSIRRWIASDRPGTHP